MAAARGRARGPDRLRRRADFLAAQAGARAHSALMTVQMRARGDDRPPRLGFTVTKRVGTAVERNRVRRRLRAAAAEALVAARPGCDYVIVARRPVLDAAFARLVGDLERAVVRVHRAKSGGGPASEEAPGRA